MKKTNFLYLLGLIITLSLSACSDDDENIGSPNDLIGTWQSGTGSGWIKENGKIIEEWTDEAIDELRVTFYEDGTFASYEYYNGKWEGELEGTWTYKNGKIYTYDFEGNLDDCMTVKSISSSSFVVEVYEKGTEGSITYEYYECGTYHKISD